MSNLYRAIGKSMLSRYAVYACSIISLMVLTRIFTPQVFGVVAAAQSIVLFFQLIAEGGLSPAIINLRDFEKRDRDGIFGLSLFVAAFLAVVMVMLGSTLAKFYNIEDIVYIIPFVSVALFANTAVVLPLALLQREQMFKRIAQAGMMAEFGALVVTVIAHYKLSALQAYALYFPVKALLNFIANLYYSGYTEFGRPLPGSYFFAIRPLLGTTSYQLGFNFMNYFSRNLDNILVGKYLGASFLGIYDRSYQLMRYPLMLLTFAMTPAIQPALREVTHDIRHVNDLHRDLAFKLSIGGSIAALGVFFFAKYIVLIAFGQQWMTVVPVIKLLALSIPAQTIMSTSGSFFQAFNRTDLMFSTGVLWTILNISAIVFGIWCGSLEALCWSLFVSFNLNFFQIYFVLHKKVLGGGYGKFLINTWPSGVATFVMASIASINNIVN
ncbi:oligosaccharide flippase family protein [Stenotrophomonas sp. MMGLT7]|uniref:oligosaccharide flippase family protein n=1 Tax=Stenotrophomonas sp. MMGLT7 TaxID=2901227 RepID=UPI001E47A31A|nr:oligosaccharide flippase family protein [Stenotrophomonas sp. MMGLT7]MCD7099313.1 oligosaccharide flippase family protein [Stenotrophomonas sp. MMGLT7]